MTSYRDTSEHDSSENESTSDENQMLSSDDIYRRMNWSIPHIERTWRWRPNDE